MLFDYSFTELNIGGRCGITYIKEKRRPILIPSALS